jgi:hypothetical protein
MDVRMRDARVGVLPYQVPYSRLRLLHARTDVLVLHPYAIAGVFVFAAGALELTSATGLLPVALLAALIAGWSSAWSP